MEDEHCCIAKFDGDPSAALFTVFDGHGGRAVASYCAEKVADTFRQTDEYRKGDYAEALVKTYLSLDEQLLKSWPSCFNELSRLSPADLKSISPNPYEEFLPGSTATSVFIKDSRLYIANAGDCRAVLWRGGEAMRLTEDHNPILPDELARIRRAGGFVQDGRVNGSLAISRAIGDFSFKQQRSRGPEEQIVIAKPEVKVQELTFLDDFLVIGCDGIWETWHTDKVMQFVSSELAKERQRSSGKLSNVAATLFDKVLAPDLYSTDGLGLDNMTCVIIDLRRRSANCTESQETTQSGSRNEATV